MTEGEALEILGVNRSASDKEVADAYRALAEIYHPDRYGTASSNAREEAARRMSRLTEAYDVVKRARHQRQTSPSGSHAGETNPPRGSRTPEADHVGATSPPVDSSNRSWSSGLALVVALGVIVLLASRLLGGSEAGTDDGWTTARGVVRALEERGLPCENPHYELTPYEREEAAFYEKVDCELDGNFVTIFMFEDSAQQDRYFRRTQEFATELGSSSTRVVGSTWIADGLGDEEAIEKLQKTLGGRIE